MSAILFSDREMSPARHLQPALQPPRAALERIRAMVGVALYEERIRRRMTLRDVAERARVSVSVVHDVEQGRSASLDSWLRIGGAFGARFDVSVTDPRGRPLGPRMESDGQDLVHAAMCDALARRLQRSGFDVALDEPYQHFQFAGRADVLAWDAAARHLLHVECRTRFPNLQAALGSYGAKRAYLPRSFAARAGVTGRWRSVSHVMAVLWSSEAIHAIRLRQASFRATCPSSTEAFDSWLAGRPPALGESSALVLFDPVAGGRRRAFVGLDSLAGVRPRYRGYAEAATALDARRPR